MLDYPAAAPILRPDLPRPATPAEVRAIIDRLEKTNTTYWLRLGDLAEFAREVYHYLNDPPLYARPGAQARVKQEYDRLFPEDEG